MSARTRATILPTESQAILSSPAIGFLAICCASQATRSSKSRVEDEPARAYGTAFSWAPQVDTTAGAALTRSRTDAPRSRWRQRFTRRLWMLRPSCPQREHTRRRRRNRTVTITPSDPKLTSVTKAPGRAQQPVQCRGDAHVVHLRKPRPQQPAASSRGRRRVTRGLRTCEESSATTALLTRPTPRILHHQTTRRPREDPLSVPVWIGKGHLMPGNEDDAAGLLDAYRDGSDTTARPPTPCRPS